MPSDPTDHREKAVEAAAIRQANSAASWGHNGGRFWNDLSGSERDGYRVAATEDVKVIDPHLRRAHFEELARRGGALPEALSAIDPESVLGIVIRAALTVAEEEALKEVAGALLPFVETKPLPDGSDDNYLIRISGDVLRRAKTFSAKAQELLEETNER